MAPAPEIRSLDELTLGHRRVLVRTDFDVPLTASGEVADDSKLRAALPTLQKALSEGARVVIATELGDPDLPAVSLEPVAAALAGLLGQEVYLPDQCVGEAARKVVSDLREGQVCLLENLRFAPEEQQADEGFARKLAGLCDVYVNEAFARSHLPWASLVTLPRLTAERGLGYRAKAELDALSRAAVTAQKPFIGILGGMDLATKLPVLESMLRRCSVICVGGVLGNTLLAARGQDMKASPLERDQLPLCRALLSRARDQKVELLLPLDVQAGSGPDAEQASAVSVGSIADKTGAFDVGPKTVQAFAERLRTAQTVLWYGALGALENPAFAQGTADMLTALGEAKAFGIITGDSVASAAAKRPELEGPDGKLGFVSTGGMASLVFIEGKKLPGIEALRG
ncbi:MAG TPA: phosphoglycerate kinase [Polyangiaceae bacterium]